MVRTTTTGAAIALTKCRLHIQRTPRGESRPPKKRFGHPGPRHQGPFQGPRGYSSGYAGSNSARYLSEPDFTQPTTQRGPRPSPRPGCDYLRIAPVQTPPPSPTAGQPAIRPASRAANRPTRCPADPRRRRPGRVLANAAVRSCQDPNQRSSGRRMQATTKLIHAVTPRAHEWQLAIPSSLLAPTLDSPRAPSIIPASCTDNLRARRHRPIETRSDTALLAQLVEQLTLNQRVEGSSPSGGISAGSGISAGAFFIGARGRICNLGALTLLRQRLRSPGRPAGAMGSRAVRHWAKGLMPPTGHMYHMLMHI
jgi:hypothetical protein